MATVTAEIDQLNTPIALWEKFKPTPGTVRQMLGSIFCVWAYEGDLSPPTLDYMAIDAFHLGQENEKVVAAAGRAFQNLFRPGELVSGEFSPSPLSAESYAVLADSIDDIKARSAGPTEEILQFLKQKLTLSDAGLLTTYDLNLREAIQTILAFKPEYVAELKYHYAIEGVRQVVKKHLIDKIFGVSVGQEDIIRKLGALAGQAAGFFPSTHERFSLWADSREDLLSIQNNPKVALTLMESLLESAVRVKEAGLLPQPK